MVSYSLLERLGNIAQENIYYSNILVVEDQLQPSLDMVAVDQVCELHQPNSWTSCESFVVV